MVGEVLEAPKRLEDQTPSWIQSEEERPSFSAATPIFKHGYNTKPTRENFKLITSRLDVNQPTLPHGLGSNFVTPPKILKRQLTGYCMSLASSPRGRDNKHGWYEKHEKLVAITAGSLSSVLLIGDSLVNGLARYHRVWSKYFKPLHALNFGVGGD